MVSSTAHTHRAVHLLECNNDDADDRWIETARPLLTLGRKVSDGSIGFNFYFMSCGGCCEFPISKGMICLSMISDGTGIKLTMVLQTLENCVRNVINRFTFLFCP